MAVVGPFHCFILCLSNQQDMRYERHWAYDPSIRCDKPGGIPPYPVNCTGMYEKGALHGWYTSLAVCGIDRYPAYHAGRALYQIQKGTNLTHQ